MNELVYAGIDGGGTRARALVVDGSGRELARRAGGAGIVRAEDPAATAVTLAELTHAVLHDAGATPERAVLCCALAGAGRAAERAAVRVALLLAHAASHVIVTGDADALMTDAFGDGAGVLLVAGTGSIAWARGAQGEPVRVGGWGMHLGDEGSGYAIGRAALHAVVRAADGRAAPTSLAPAVLASLGLEDPADLIGWAARAAKADVAALTPLVLQHAVDGDRAAVEIREAASRELVLLAVTAARRASLARPAIALAGGLIEPGAALRQIVSVKLEEALPDCTLLPDLLDGARGAAVIARRWDQAI